MNKSNYQTDAFITTMFSCWMLGGLYVAGWKCFLFLLLFISVYAISIAVNKNKKDYFATSFSTAFLIACILFCISYLSIYLITEEPKEIIFPDAIKNFKHKYIPLILGASIPLGLLVGYINAVVRDRLKKR